MKLVPAACAMRNVLSINVCLGVEPEYAPGCVTLEGVAKIVLLDPDKYDR